MAMSNRSIGIVLGLTALLIMLLGAALAVHLQGAGRDADRTQQDADATSPPTYWAVPEFTLADHAGGTLASADLAGTVWLASFVYTHCPDFCPLVTQRMAELRDTLEATGILGRRVRLISITVDPARDSPDVLREYAAAFGATDPAEWAFLTGEPGAVRALIEDGFKVSAARETGEETGNYTILHSDRILLIDATGQVRGFYAATDTAEQARLEEDLRAVLEG